MFNSNAEIINVNQYIFNHKKDFNNQIGKKLREIRSERNISTEILAQRTMMSPSYIIQIENGINGLSLNKFIILCNALEINPNELLEDFMYGCKNNEDILYYELQKDKNISMNILNYLKNEENGYLY